MPQNPEQWLALLTGALALATFVLAWHTWRMAQVARQSLALEGRPYLAFTGFVAMPGAPGKREFRPLVRWENKGRVLLHYRVESFAIQANDRVPPDSALKGTEGVAFPGVPVEFVGPTVFDIDVRQYWKGRVNFKITYWSSGSSKKFVAEDEFDVEGQNPTWVRWTRTKAPNYT